MKIAIVGAGFAGTYLAFKLNNLGHKVTLFEKSRGVGGRMATRHIDEHDINHGCHALTPKGDTFKAFCQQLTKEGILKKKSPNSYVSTAMNLVLKHLSKEITLYPHSLIETLIQNENGYSLIDSQDNCHKGFDFVVLTLPAPQILALNFSLESTLRDKLHNITFDAVATLVLYGKDVTRLNKVQLSTMKHLKKLYVPNDTTVIVHMDREFSNKHKRLSKDAITPYITDEIQRVLPNFKLNHYEYFSHLWKYGFTATAMNQPYIYDAKRAYAITADWLLGSEVEDAFNSVEALVDEQFTFVNEEV